MTSAATFATNIIRLRTLLLFALSCNLDDEFAITNRLTVHLANCSLSVLRLFVGLHTNQHYDEGIPIHELDLAYLPEGFKRLLEFLFRHRASVSLDVYLSLSTH